MAAFLPADRKQTEIWQTVPFEWLTIYAAIMIVAVWEIAARWC